MVVLTPKGLGAGNEVLQDLEGNHGGHSDPVLATAWLFPALIRKTDVIFLQCNFNLVVVVSHAEVPIELPLLLGCIPLCFVSLLL